jgi:hypothetical protein
MDDDTGLRVLQVKIGLRTFWLQWSVSQDRGETVIEIVLSEQIQ